MATSLFPPPPGHGAFEHDLRPHSQSGSEQRDRKDKARRSPNSVKAKPAKPAVINNILSSFDALSSPSIITASSDGLSDTTSRRSRPHSADGTVGSEPSLAYSGSAGFGVEYGHDLLLEDETGMSDAALPPTVRTTRSQKGLLQYKPSRRLSFTTSGKGHKGHMRRSSSVNSRRESASLRNREKERFGKYKLSSESWVKQGQMNRDVLSDELEVKRQMSLPGTSSQEFLSPLTERTELKTAPANLSSVSRVEQIIAKTPRPTTSSSKRRLYLTDAGCNEDQALPDSPPSVADSQPITADLPSLSRDIEMREKSPLQQLIEDASGDAEAIRLPRQMSPQKSPIVDSIPMRTSSLRQASKSPGPGKKRNKKSKRHSKLSYNEDDNSDFAGDRSSKVIADSSWADLGDDDETVKRIRELRERRRSRMGDSLTPSTSMDVARLETSPIVGRRSASARIGMEAQEARPGPQRAVTEPFLATAEVVESVSSGMNSVRDGPPLNAFQTSDSPDRRHRTNLSLDETRSAVRPMTARSNNPPTPPLSLDYSYAEIVDALQGVKREIKKDKQERREKAAQSPDQVRTPSMPLIEPQSANTTPVRSRSKGIRWKPSPSTNHPDLPTDFEKKKSRRKSTSDARNAKYLDNDAVPSIIDRDSVELAVNDYLNAERLSRKIKHPVNHRVISFSEVGDPNGAAVFVCVGMGLTRYVTAFYDELATTLRLRLITIDRPGVGNSEPYPPSDRSGPLNWPDDVLSVCQNLGITKFSILAHSAGAIYALATALILPHLIKGKLHLLAPWIPPSQLEAPAHPAASIAPAGALPRSQRFLRVLPTPFLRAANASFMTATSSSLKPATKTKARSEIRPQNVPNQSSRGKERPQSRGVRGTDSNRRESLMLMDQLMPETNPLENFPIPGNEDGETLRNRNPFMAATASPADPQFEFASSGLEAAEYTEKERKHEYSTLLTQRTWELATRDSNPATDLLVCLERQRDVGFRYTDVHREVVITHGAEDKRVPLANIKWLTEQMNRRAFPVTTTSGSAPSSREGWDVDMLAKGGCELRVLEGEGHGLMASPLIMGDVLTEIADYWSGQRNLG